MKRALLIFCVLIFALLNVACAKTTTNLQNFASQDAFLKDMAAGITKRLNDDRSEENMSSEEAKEFYNDLVGYELSYIEKYVDAQFEDSTFNELSHRYIEACVAQRTALSFYRNEDLYNALWTGGKTIRSGIIVAMYEQYNLPLSSQEVESYRNSGGATSVTTEVSGAEGLEELNEQLDEIFPNRDAQDIVLESGDLKFVDGSCIQNGNNVDYSIVLKNSSKLDIASIGLYIAILDRNENVLGVELEYLFASIPSNKQGTVTGSFKLDDYPDAHFIRIDSFAYDGNNDHSYYTGTFFDADKEASITPIQ